MLKEFSGPDGKPFMEAPINEGRLVFGLNMDAFAPYSKKTGGKQVSVTGIYLICFNLPPDIRYKAENVFLVGIVPGPTEPHTDQVNHVLRPLVNDLMVLWEKGIYIRKTHKYPLGRPVCGAMLPLICDLPAARRASGHAAHSATTFCSECYLKKEDINNINRDTWPPCNHSNHVKYANLWKNAKTPAEQNSEFSKHNVRWSELLRLPYWDPTKHVVIDPMHGFYLRMFFRHIREIWGMRADSEDGDGTSSSFLKTVLKDKQIQHAEHILRHGTFDQLKRLSQKAVNYLCQDRGLVTMEDVSHVTKLSLLENYVCRMLVFLPM